MFTQAIVRQPALTLTQGITTAGLGLPDYEKALAQHQSYIDALKQCGLEVTVLPPDPQYPDSCFIEDPALLTEQAAILTRPGALSRQGEVAINMPAIKAFYGDRIREIQSPGTLDAGDVMRIENHFYIGLSARTNWEGAKQLIQLLEQYGYSSSVVKLKEVLHLKTGVSYLGNGNLLVSGEFIGHEEFKSLNQIMVDDAQSYAANCIEVNGTILMPAGFDKTISLVKILGYPVLEIDTSEFRKLDGGLSCLSLRF